jgi:hypothetical protein
MLLVSHSWSLIFSHFYFVEEVKGFTNISDKTDSLTKDGDCYSELAKKLHLLIDNNMFADVYFEVCGRRIAAHRNILSCRCDFFKTVFDNESNINRKSPIFIPDLNYDAFIQIIGFLYTGHIDNSCELSCYIELLRVVDLFNLKPIEELIIFHLCKYENKSGWIEYLFLFFLRRFDGRN